MLLGMVAHCSNKVIRWYFFSYTLTIRLLRLFCLGEVSFFEVDVEEWLIGAKGSTGGPRDTTVWGFSVCSLWFLHKCVFALSTLDLESCLLYDGINFFHRLDELKTVLVFPVQKATFQHLVAVPMCLFHIQKESHL